MARKALQTDNPSHAVTTEQMPGLPAAIKNLAQSADIEKDEILGAGIELGRLDAMGFVATIANSAVLSIYENVKKTKAWRYLKNCDGRNFGSLDEFCLAKLGMSYRRLQEINTNHKTLGPDAFEQAERLGLRQVDHNLIKALPAPKQEIIKEALSEGATKEELQKSIRELAAADQKEIESLQTDLAHAKESAADKDCVIEQKNKKIGELVEQMNRQAALTDAERATEQERALNDAVIETLGGLVVLNQRIAEIRNTGEKTPHGLYIACQGALNRVIEEVIAVSNDWGIAIDPMAGFGAAADVAMPDNTAAGEAAYYDDPNAGEDVGGEDWTAFAR